MGKKKDMKQASKIASQLIELFEEMIQPGPTEDEARESLDRLLSKGIDKLFHYENDPKFSPEELALRHKVIVDPSQALAKIGIMIHETFTPHSGQFLFFGLNQEGAISVVDTKDALFGALNPTEARAYQRAIVDKLLVTANTKYVFMVGDVMSASGRCGTCISMYQLEEGKRSWYKSLILPHAKGDSGFAPREAHQTIDMLAIGGEAN